MSINDISKIKWALVLLFALFFSPPALSQSGTPIGDRQGVPFAEAGNWWDIARPGEGLVLERQGNMAGVILFTYTASGEPDFYLATAPLASFNMGIGTPPTPIIGAARSAIILDGTLIRFKNGPVLNSSRRYFEGDPPANETESVGRIIISMWLYSSALSVDIMLDEDRVPEGSERITRRTYHKSRFGHGGLGKYVDATPEPLQASRPCWTDLRGRWVFANNSDTVSRDAWSFNFTELETSPAPQDMICTDHSDAFGNTIMADHTLLYRDTETGATLRCVTKSSHPGVDPDYRPEDQRCVLRTEDGEALLWFAAKDTGARQIIASPGVPPDDYRHLRGHPQVIGLRLD